MSKGFAYSRGLKPQIGIQGLAEFNKNMRQFKEAAKDMRKAMSKIGKNGKRIAQSQVPRDTGDLRKDHRIRTKKNEVLISTNIRTDYAFYVHFGAPANNQAPNPWLYRSVGLNERFTYKTLDREMDRLCRKYGAPSYA